MKRITILSLIVSILFASSAFAREDKIKLNIDDTYRSLATAFVNIVVA